MADTIYTLKRPGLADVNLKLIDNGDSTYSLAAHVADAEVVVDLKDADVTALTNAIAAAFAEGDVTAIAAAIDTALRASDLKVTLDGEAVQLAAGTNSIGDVGTPDTAPPSAGEAVNIAAADHACSSTTRALYVGGAGDVIATIGGVDLTFKAVPAGTVLPMQATVIKKVGTTATYMVALW